MCSDIDAGEPESRVTAAIVAAAKEWLAANPTRIPDWHAIDAVVHAIGIGRNGGSDWRLWLIADIAIAASRLSDLGILPSPWVPRLAQAANAGHAPAQAELAYRAKRGQLTPALVSLGAHGDEAPLAVIEAFNHAQYGHWLPRAAEAGDSWAECQFGIDLLKGASVLSDDAAAVRWFEKAARNASPNPVAEFLLAYAMEGEEYGSHTRFKLYSQAAESGVPEAMVALGHCIEHGIGTRCDVQQAIIWYERAGSERSDGYLLAARLANDAGMETEALRLYRLAADDDHAEALWFIGEHDIHIGLREDWFAETNEAWQRGFSALQRAAELGHPEAAISVALWYENPSFFGPGDPAAPAWVGGDLPSLEDAIHYYELAVKGGLDGYQDTIERLRRELNEEAEPGEQNASGSDSRGEPTG